MIAPLAASTSLDITSKPRRHRLPGASGCLMVYRRKRTFVSDIHGSSALAAQGSRLILRNRSTAISITMGERYRSAHEQDDLLDSRG